MKFKKVTFKLLFILFFFFFTYPAMYLYLGNSFQSVVAYADRKNTSPSINISYAVYKCVVDTDSLRANITHSALSGNGQRIVFSGVKCETKELALYTVNVNDGYLNEIPLPNLEGRGISELAINKDGSRIFFNTGGLKARLYTVKGSNVTMLFDAASNSEFVMIEQIQCTADGNELYFLNRGGYSGDIWKIMQDGSGLTKLIEDTEVIHSDAQGGMGYRVTEFAISNNAEIISFILQGYFDRNNIHIRYSKSELFVFRRDAIQQLTNDSSDIAKNYLAISGNGKIIVMLKGPPHNKWVSVYSKDGIMTGLTMSRGGGKPILNYDGSRMFIAEDGGCLINTDGSSTLSLLPVSDIPLSMHGSPSISDDGYRVSFHFGYSSWPFKEALYVGHFLDSPQGVWNAPVIQNIMFEPTYMPRVPSTNVTFTAKITDPQGSADLKRVRMDQLVNGIKESSSNFPATFYWWPNDEGIRGDKVANDSIYTSIGSPTGKINEFDNMIVRVGAMDGNGNMAVTYAMLGIGEEMVPQLISHEVEGEKEERLSLPQKDIADFFGPPSMFTIAYLPLGEEDKYLVRYETWTYPEHKKEITFVAGEILTVNDTPAEIDYGENEVNYSGLRPEWFDFGMNFSDVAKVIGSSDFERVESLIEGFEEEGVEVYLGENALFCMQDGYLLYLETFGT